MSTSAPPRLDHRFHRLFAAAVDPFVRRLTGAQEGGATSAEEIVSRLKNDLLEKDAMGSAPKVDLLQDRIRNLLREPDLRIGLIGITRGDDVEAIMEAKPVGRSLLLCDPLAFPQLLLRGNPGIY